MRTEYKRIGFAAGVVILAVMSAHARPSGTGEDDGSAGPPSLLVGPVTGLTEGWHRAPEATAMPVNTVAQFAIDARRSDVVTWTGAFEVARSDSLSTAVCPLLETGPQTISVTVRRGAEEMSGGQIVVESEPGNGTRFTFDLPASSAAA